MSDTGENNGCRQADERLVDYLYDELEPAERQAFERHLDVCPEHRQQVLKLQAVLEMVRADNAAVESVDVSEPVIEQAHRLLPEQRPRRSWWLLHWQPLAAAAAAGLVAVVVGVLSWRQLQPRSASLSDTVTIDGVVANREEKTAAVAPAAEPAGATTKPKAPLTAFGQSYRQGTPAEIPVAADGRTARAGGKGVQSRRHRIARKRSRRRAPARRAAPSPASVHQRPIARPIGGLTDAEAPPALAEKRSGEDEATRYRRDNSLQAQGQARKKSLAFATSPAPSPAPLRADKAVGYVEKEAPAMAAESPTGSKRVKSKARPEDRDQAGQVDELQAQDSLDKARRLLAEKRPRRAARLLQRYLGKEPAGSDRKQALFLLARAWMAVGDCRRQVRAASRALAADPSHPQAAATLLDQASCLVRLQRIETARRAYRRVIDRYPARAAEARKGLRLLQRL